ncbi:unnamed protein product [Withania somnifera]
MGDFEICNFTLQFLRGRWFMMFASFLIMAGAGATYLFGVYSKTIKSTLGYDQSTLNLLGTIKDLGANVGVLYWSFSRGNAYLVSSFTVTKKMATPKVWQMCLYICIGANSRNFANTGSLVTCVKNFPESRGMMLGLMKGYVGLSGAIFTQLYLAIYGNDSKSLILLIGWFPALLSILFIFSIREKKFSRHPNEVKVFYENLIISIVLALLLMGLTISQKYLDFSHIAYVACATIVCMVLLFPCIVAIREEYSCWKLKKKELESTPTRVLVEEPLAEYSSNMVKTQEKKEVGCFSDIFKKPKRGDDYTILQALLSIDMLILFVATFCGLGCSLTAIDNLGQIGESLGYPQHTISTFVSLMSIWNYFGRVCSGFVCEKLVLKWKVPRTLIMTFALVLPAIGDLIIAFPFPHSVYVASLLIGFSFGIQLTLLFVIISSFLNLKYYSTLFNCGQLASPLGSYILNVKIVGKLYDNEALKQLASKGLTRSMVKELTCIGKQCYRNSFIILACANLFGALVSLILVMRTKDYYKSDIYKRFRDRYDGSK